MDLNTKKKRKDTEEITTCTICKHPLKGRYNVERHMRTHTNERPYKCSICPLSFSTKRSRNNHLYNAHGLKTYPIKIPTRNQCIFCSKMIISSGMNYHLKRHIQEKLFSCSICDKQFINKTPLNQHMNTHTKVQGAPCIFCGKTLSIHTNTEDHLRYHIKEKPFSCKKCPWAFSTAINLRSHIRTVHLKELRFECNICEKSFLHKNRDAHIRSHLMEKHFQCQVCGKRLRSSFRLKSHLELHKESRISFSCLTCNKVYSRLDSLKQHEKKEHEAK
ncbi:unnamed protein product [Orchesella dallaii]|uniref:C2H2-type domain-containing protein n=1 Tax=Orchesella dallaii TaxID=48710 RepID=A0ABP1RQ25_9HEXA